MQVSRSIRADLVVCLCVRMLGGLLRPTEGTVYIPPQLHVLVVPAEPVLIAGEFLGAINLTLAPSHLLYG